MRWFMFHCILLISLSIVSAKEDDHPKQKRDLAFVKNLIKSAIFGSNKNSPLVPIVTPNDNGNYKVFRIPGFNKVLVKAIPKVAVAAETVVPVPDKVGVIAQDPAIALVSSYLGTKTPVETLNALEGVKNLLQSGILTASRDASPIISQLPYIPFISAIRKTEPLPISPMMIDSAKMYTSVKQVQNPMYVLPTIAGRPVLAYQMPKQMIPIVPPLVTVPVPNIVKTIRPMQVPIPALPNSYSYKQMHEDGTVTSYTANDGHNVQVTKSDKPLPLTPFMPYRLREIINLGAERVNVGMPVPLTPIMRPAQVQLIDYLKINPYRRVQPQAIGVNNNYSYKQIHNDGTMTTYSGSGLPGSNVQVFTGVGGRPTTPAFIEDRIEKINTDSKDHEFANSKPVGAFSYRTVHKDGSVTTHPASRPGENIKIVSGPTLAPAYWHNPQPSKYPTFDSKEEVKVQVGTNTNKDIYHQVASPSMFSYQTLDKNGSVAKVNGDSPFSYRIVHSDGTVTNYGASGVISEKNSNDSSYTNRKPEATFAYKTVQNDSIPVSTVSSDLLTNKKDNNVQVNSDSFYYRIEHNDGTATIVHSDGSVTRHQDPFSESNIGHNSTMSTDSLNNKLLNINGEKDFVQNEENLYTNKKMYADPNNSSSYKTIHTDGSFTTHSKQENKDIEMAAASTEYAKSENSGQQLSHGTVNNIKLPNTASEFSHIIAHSALAKNDTQKSTSRSPVSSTVSEFGNSFSYKIVHSDGSVTTYGTQGLQENKDAKLATTSIEHSNHNIPEMQKVSINGEVSRLNLPINPNVPSSGSSENSYKLAHNALYTNNNVGTTANNLSVAPVTVAVASSDAVLFSKPVVSRYMYKQINHSSPNKFTVVNLDESERRDKVVMDNVQIVGSENINSKVEKIPNNYVYIPPTSVNVPLPTKHENMTLPNDSYVYMPPASANAPLPIKPLNINEQNTKEFSQESSLSTNPIVVLDEPMTYSYQQSNSDGSFLNVKSSQNIVSVKVTPPNTLNRGDIPDASY